MRKALVSAALGFVAACSGTQMPVGPPPEYEDPPAPSWYEAGAPATAEPEPQPQPQAQPLELADAGAEDGGRD